MSTRKGDASRQGQKYQNSSAYNPSRYGQSRRVKQAAALTLGGLCARCKEKIEWKRKYDKYKPLAAPKKCILCQSKQVKQAYYQICQKCSEEKEICAKCGQKEDIVEGFPADKIRTAKEETEFRAGLRQMKERERRTLFREQSKGQSQATESSTKATDVEKSLVDNNNPEELEQLVEGGELTDTNFCDPAVPNSDSYGPNCTCTCTSVIVENDAQQ